LHEARYRHSLGVPRGRVIRASDQRPGEPGAVRQVRAEHAERPAERAAHTRELQARCDAENAGGAERYPAQWRVVAALAGHTKERDGDAGHLAQRAGRRRAAVGAGTLILPYQVADLAISAVIAGPSASEDARKRAGDPAIHLLAKRDGCTGQARAEATL